MQKTELLWNSKRSSLGCYNEEFSTFSADLWLDPLLLRSHRQISIFHCLSVFSAMSISYIKSDRNNIKFYPFVIFSLLISLILSIFLFAIFFIYSTPFMIPFTSLIYLLILLFLMSIIIAVTYNHNEELRALQNRFEEQVIFCEILILKILI